jgi:hypothetical protein
MASTTSAVRTRDLGAGLPTPLALWSRRIALFSLQLIVVTIVLHRLFSLSTPLALNLFATALCGAAIALLLGLVAMAIIWRQGRGGMGSAAGGILVSLILLTWPAVVFGLARTMPSINDITTDAQLPPQFAALSRARPKGANTPVYPGPRFSRIQLESYPDIRPVVVPRPAAETFELVQESVRRMRWTVAAEQPPQGRGKPGLIEASDRTLVLGFTDDIAIRVDATVTGHHGRRRARPGAAVPRRLKGAQGQMMAPQKSQGRGQPGAQRGQQLKERQRWRAEDQARDKRSQRSQ